MGGDSQDELITVSKSSSDWIDALKSGLKSDGVVVVKDVLDDRSIARSIDELEMALSAVVATVGRERLRSPAREFGVARIPMKYQPWFLSFFEIPEVLQVIDQAVGNTAICHLQNGFLLPPDKESVEAFQLQPHQDFPRHLNGYVASVNTFFPLSDFTIESGATQVLVGSH